MIPQFGDFTGDFLINSIRIRVNTEHNSVLSNFKNTSEHVLGILICISTPYGCVLHPRASGVTVRPGRLLANKGPLPIHPKHGICRDLITRAWEFPGHGRLLKAVARYLGSFLSHDPSLNQKKKLTSR